MVRRLLVAARAIACAPSLCHPERTREGSGPEARGQILREYAQDDKLHRDWAYMRSAWGRGEVVRWGRCTYDPSAHTPMGIDDRDYTRRSSDATPLDYESPPADEPADTASVGSVGLRSVSTWL